mgnify:CR=1 FL=1
MNPYSASAGGRNLPLDWLAEADLQADIRYLATVWAAIQKRNADKSAPAIPYSEHDLPLRLAAQAIERGEVNTTPKWLSPAAAHSLTSSVKSLTSSVSTARCSASA